MSGLIRGADRGLLKKKEEEKKSKRKKETKEKKVKRKKKMLYIPEHVCQRASWESNLQSMISSLANLLRSDRKAPALFFSPISLLGPLFFLRLKSPCL